MGQYYRLFNLDKSQTLSPSSFFDGASKLMEPCFCSTEQPSEYIDTILHLMMHEWEGDRVVFCGDYAFEPDEAGYPTIMFSCPLALRKRIARNVTFDPWELCQSVRFGVDLGEPIGKDVSQWHHHEKYEPVIGSLGHGCEHYRYVINETLGVYYDRQTLPVAWLSRDDDPGSESFGQVRIYRLDPLTLFLALGNGLGGGDYHGKEGIDQIGSWAFYRVRGTNDEGELAGLDEIRCPFNERRVRIEAKDDVIQDALSRLLPKCGMCGLPSLEELAEQIAKTGAPS